MDRKVKKPAKPPDNVTHRAIKAAVKKVTGIRIKAAENGEE